MNKRLNKFSLEVRERAVRLVQEHRGEYPSLWAAIESIAPKIGCVPQTLSDWVKRYEVDSGQREGLSSSEREQLKALQREVKELRRANDILKTASAFFDLAGSTADSRIEGLHRPTPRHLWGRADLQVLQIAPSCYRRHAAQLRDPALRCDRAKQDDELIPQVQRVWHANMQVYGADKVWKQLNREGIPVARCTVERLMRQLGLRGVRRGKVVRTTVSNANAPCPLDRVNRHFKAQRPNQLWVSDFTYVSTWQGWLYVVFVVDVFARRIVGWRVSSSMHTDFVLDALEQALFDRQPERHASLIHHSDRGSQYVSIRYSERLAEAGMEPSVGSRGDSYDNELAETINGLYKAELIHRRGPWKTKESVELATLQWVHWFNYIRLLGAIGYIPPAEAAENYYRQLANSRETSVSA